MEIFALGIGVGLASVAGLRAFLPLALAALFAALGAFELPVPFVSVGVWILFSVLAALAVVEVVLDKVRSAERVFNLAMVPVRAASGALLFAVALGLDVGSGSAVWLVAGAAVAGAVAVLKAVLRPRSVAGGAGVSPTTLSAFEDVVAVVGGIGGFFVPFVPVLLVAFLLFFLHRIRRRRGRKYEGLRILGD